MSILKKLLRDVPILIAQTSQSGKLASGPVWENLREGAGRAIHIRCDSVAQFVSEFSSDPNCFIDEIPTVAPPFELSFLEWRGDFPINSGGKIVQPSPENAGTSFAAMISGERDDDGWTIGLSMFSSGKERDSPVVYLATMDVRTDTSGRVVTWDGKNVYRVATGFTGAERDAVPNMLNLYVYTALFTFGLMHCKNVTLIDDPSTPRQRKNSSGERTTRWKVLQIDAMKSALRRARESPESDGTARRALHICRGHFKDYRQSGLFGKHKDVFWWDDWLRGEVSRGIVGKEYTVSMEAS